MTPEKIYVDSLLGMSACWTPNRIASDDVEYIRADLQEADAYYQGMAHGKQAAAIRELVEAASNVHKLVTLSGPMSQPLPSYHSVSILGRVLEKWAPNLSTHLTGVSPPIPIPDPHPLIPLEREP